MALLLLLSLPADAGVISASLPLGPGTNLFGEQAVPFAVTDPELITLSVSFNEQASNPTNCQGIDASVTFSCSGAVSPQVNIVGSAGTIATIAANYAFTCNGNSSTFPNCIESDDFVGFSVTCNGTQNLSGDSGCMITGLPVGFYQLILSQNEDLAAAAGSIVAPFSDSISADLIGSVILTPEPNVGVFCGLLFAALLGSRFRRLYSAA